MTGPAREAFYGAFFDELEKLGYPFIKLSGSEASVLELIGAPGATLPQGTIPHGFETRTQQVQGVRNLPKKLEGPRQHAPRLSKPHV